MRLGGNTLDKKVERLVNDIENLKEQLNSPKTIKEVMGYQNKAFYEQVEEMAKPLAPEFLNQQVRFQQQVHATSTVPADAHRSQSYQIDKGNNKEACLLTIIL